METKWIFNTASSFNQFWNTKNYQNQPRFNGVYSRGNLPKIKDGAYVINLDEYSDIGNHWVALWIDNSNNVTYFDSFGVKHIPKEIKAFINNKKIKINIFRIQVYDSLTYGFFVLVLLILCLQEKH